MTNLRDFLNQKSSQNDRYNSTSNEEKKYEEIMKDNPEKVENIKDNLKKYQNMSQNDLMSELMKEASRMKANGTLDESSLNTLKSVLLPMLNEEQKEMLSNILNQLK